MPQLRSAPCPHKTAFCRPPLPPAADSRLAAPSSPLPQALAFVYDKELVQNLFNAAPERYAERQGGYTRIKTEPFLRRGDAAEMAIIELV